MQTASIHVNSLNASYQLPRSRAGASVSVQKRLDRIAADLLVRSLENEFHAPEFISGGLYFIERLNFDFALDINHNDESLAKVWARALNESIHKTILAGDIGVIAFRDRAAFLVGLVEHLLRGSQWDWYYDEFSGLRSLSRGQAITKLLSEDPDNGREILLQLTRRGALDLLLASLSEAEVAHIVDVCLLPQSPSFTPAGAYERWTGAVRELLSGPIRLEFKLAHDIVRVYLSLLLTRPELGPDVNLARFVRDLLQLRQFISSLKDAPQLLTLIGVEDMATCLALTGPNEAVPLLENLIRSCGGADTAALLRQMEASPGMLDQFVTEFGGVFFLAPAILDLGAADLLDAGCAFPDPEFGSRRAWLIFLTALQCLGPHASSAWNDKALTTFAGLSTASSRESVEAYAATLTPAMHDGFARAVETIAHLAAVASMPEGTSASSWFSICHDREATDKLAEFDQALARFSATVLRSFAARLGAFADSSPSFLYQNFLASRASVEISSERIGVRFLSSPLQMVLRMAGFDRDVWRIPWLEHRTLEFTFD